MPTGRIAISGNSTRTEEFGLCRKRFRPSCAGSTDEVALRGVRLTVRSLQAREGDARQQFASDAGVLEVAGLSLGALVTRFR
jgi:hypothetical protein